jgi:dTDP-4-amino-4,6-dideoxygalactose transaminase
MDPLVALARKHNLKLIEDCAHSIESSYRGTPAGLFGDTGCFSFYATKNISTGDGGMVVTRNPRVARRVRRLSLHGMTADAWTRSAGRGREGYQVVAPGFKYNMTDNAAALGSAQLAKVETHWTRREQLWNYYNALLAEAGVALPPAPGNHERHAYHLYAIGLPLEDLTVSRAQIMAAMRAENIGVGVHYLPVHMQPYYRRAFGYRPEDFPVAAHTGTRTLSLPLAAGMTYEDVSDACTALKRVLRYFRLPRSHAGAPQNETASSTAMERQTA